MWNQFRPMTNAESRMRRQLLCTITLLLWGGIATAQILPDAPSVATGAFPSPAIESGQTVVNASKPGAVPAARGPWIDPKVADLNYWGATSALLGTTILNVDLTARCASQRTCLTWLASDSTKRDLYLYTLPTDAALSYLTYKLKAKRRWWILPDAVFTAANIFSAGRSYGRLNVYVKPQQAALLPAETSGKR
jgi:hypothetical protein